MTSAWIVSLFAIFVWWFATGAILVAVRRADRLGNHGAMLVKALPILLFGFWAVHTSLTEVSVAGVYLGFAGALAIWGWIELAFLAGVISGPVREDCPQGLDERARFFRAFGTVAYHELALAVGFLGLVLASGGAPNQMAMATYLILFLARISAKLNLFFGVPRINIEFLPQSLSHLASHFRIATLNWVFPVSITTLNLAVACWLERIHAATTTAETIGFVLLTAITALALLEHWLMVLPLPDAKLWRWMLPAPKTDLKKTRPEGHHGI